MRDIISLFIWGEYLTAEVTGHRILGETIIRHTQHSIQSGFFPIYSAMNTKRDVLASTARQRLNHSELLSSCCVR